MNKVTLIKSRVDADLSIDAQAVNSKTARELYHKRTQIYPKLTHGTFRNLKWIAMVVLLGIYYLTPWLRWDRGPGSPDQAVLIDFAGRRFYFFFIELWPQEVYYITGLLILASFGIFLSSALFGRVWCGYACPQTVWTDLYIYIERLIEGDRNDRMRLDKAPLSLSKAGKKISKHALWLAVAAATGGAWVFYFGDAPTMFREVFTGAASVETYLFIGILTFTTYALAGTMREQVCTYLCPWPRIQAAMIDKDALSVAYRTDRGEPRGPHKKGETWDGRGDCIDCRQCVAVCPQGIDIRDGDQLECINCALCIDACDDVMKKVGRPTGLIAYDSYANLERRSQGKAQRYRIIRPRTILYGALMTLVGVLMIYGLATRQTLDVNVIRDRSPPFVRLADGSIRNDYEVKVINMRNVPRTVAIELTGLAGAHLQASTLDAEGRVVLRAEADRVTGVRVHVVAPSSVSPGSHPLRFTVRDLETGASTGSASAFLAGASP